ncbi:NAD-dependent epimerase/dehydratase family protein [Pseudooctadecabacter sp.]|uniref:NAD-dependent epimerase/dehydratase family protein n=1 Tax=Pseudooctadecabacter sp. TaxID=1966338 RepID=UPI0025D46656|nr:SDR family oxidoreductase [Pseudooctadecabacter sp.]
MQTVILGAQGQLGGVLHRHARRAGLDWTGQGRRAGADVIWSLQDKPAEAVFPENGTIINMIGYAGPDEDALQQANIDATDRILTLAKAHGVAHVILASSAAVYGNAGTAPITEEAPLSPLTPYADSKVRMEALAQAAAGVAGSPAITILRIGNVAGSDALTTIARRRIAAGAAMDLHRFADGTAPVRSYIGPRDLFDVVAALAPQPPAAIRTVNVAAPDPVPLDHVMTAYKTHVLPDLVWQDAPAPDSVPKRVILSIQALRALVDLPSASDYATHMARQVQEDISP